MQPNTGVTFYRAPCPCVSHGKVKECKPKYGRCMNGTRFIPVKLLDVAGLVPGASEVREGGKADGEERREGACMWGEEGMGGNNLLIHKFI